MGTMGEKSKRALKGVDWPEPCASGDEWIMNWQMYGVLSQRLKAEDLGSLCLASAWWGQFPGQLAACTCLASYWALFQAESSGQGQRRCSGFHSPFEPLDIIPT